MLKGLIFIFCCFFIGCLLGQEKGTGKHEFPQVTITLSPIVKDGAYYYFNGKRGTFESVILPLTALNDESIKKYIKGATIARKSSRATMYLAMLYVFSELAASPTHTTPQTARFKTVLLSSMAISQALVILEGSFKRRAVNRYNDLIFLPQALILPGNQFGLGIKLKF